MNLAAILEQIQATTATINAPIATTEEDLAEARKHLIAVNWNTRVVQLPSAYSSYISVATDHRAATVYFEADRFFDGVDLAQQTIAVEYLNASGEGRVYPVVDLDYITDPEKLIFGWKIGHDLTKTPGEVKFMVHVFSIDPSTHKYTYSLHTQPCSARILKTLDIDEDIGLEDMYGIDAKEVQDLFGRIAQLERKAVVWYDLIGTPDGNSGGNSSYDYTNPDEWDPWTENPNY